MKPNTINLQIVVNLGNYESCRIGGEWSLDDGESVVSAMEKAREELRNSFTQLYIKRDGKYVARASEPQKPDENQKQQ